MERQHGFEGRVTRRRFLYRVAAAGLTLPTVGGLLGACASAPAAAPTPAERIVEKTVVVTPTPAPRKIELKYGHVLSATDPQHKLWEQVANRIKERTNGDVVIQVFPGGQLGGDRDLAEQSRLGAPIIAGAAVGYLAEYIKDYNALTLPYLFTDWDQQGKKIAMSPLMNELNERYLKQAGMVVLAQNYFVGERHVIAKRQINKPDDMKGLKIRIPPIDMWRDTFAAFGAAPTPLEWAEVYPALQQGVIEGAEAFYSSLRSSKLHEIAKFVATTGHFSQISVYHVGFKMWDSLPKDVQQVITEEWVKGCDEGSRIAIDGAAAEAEGMKREGATIVEVDRKSFEAAAKSVWDKYTPDFSKGLLDRVLQLRDA
jgi:tripartite ATP-independent transporter DctP family solute receptor